jgi:hypothetical protein
VVGHLADGLVREGLGVGQGLLDRVGSSGQPGLTGAYPAWAK